MATTLKVPARRATSPAKSPVARSVAVPTKTPIVRAKPPKPVRNVAASKPKLIRGDFAIPETDYALIAELKATAKRGGSKVKKNEILRLGLQSLQSLSPAELHDRILAMQLPDKGITK